MRRLPTIQAGAVVLAAGALMVIGCGGDDKPPKPEPTPAATAEGKREAKLKAALRDEPAVINIGAAGGGLIIIETSLTSAGRDARRICRKAAQLRLDMVVDVWSREGEAIASC